MFGTVMSPQQAVQMVKNMSAQFNIPPLSVALNCEECFWRPNILACFIPKQDLICLREDKIHPRLIAHELGHAYFKYHFAPDVNAFYVDKASEKFAQYFEFLWEATGFNMNCQVCRNTMPWAVLRTGDVQCLNCASVYQVVL